MLKTDYGFETGLETSVNNLQGLREITSIESGLSIRGDHRLKNLKGLENLTEIGGGLGFRGWVFNEYLESLDGLENLESIGGGLFIAANSNLTSLEALKNLKSLGGPLEIGWRFMYELGNESLKSLKGLENIDPGSISSLKIIYNQSLSECEVQSICQYLAAPNGTVEIHDNGQGCSSELEIEDKCEALTVLEYEISPGFAIYPNPASDELNILSNNGCSPDRVNIYNELGELVFTDDQVLDHINLSNLHDGLYFLEIISNPLIKRVKLVIN
jgi:hypothetical protein